MPAASLSVLIVLLIHVGRVPPLELSPYTYGGGLTARVGRTINDINERQ